MIKPYYNYILVKVEEEPTNVSKAGVLMSTTTAYKNTLKGRVVAVSDGMTQQGGIIVPHYINIDDVVMFRPDTALEIVDDGEDYKLIAVGSIIAIIE